MRPGALTLAVLALSAVLAPTPARALQLENLRVDVTLVEQTSQDPFRIRGRLVGVDPKLVVQESLRLRFGALRADIPAGGFRRRGRSFVWRSYLFGVKKVTFDVKKATIAVVGGDIELGDLPGPVTLALATPRGNLCGRITSWSSAYETLRGGKRTRRRSTPGPLESCVPPPGTDRTPPHVLITTPTSRDGTTTAVPTIALGGVALDDVSVAGLSWSNDRGGGGSLLPAADWAVDVPLQLGDNRVTVSATDPSGNQASDAIAVTYNTNGIVFDGVPEIDPDTLFFNGSSNAAVRQRIAPNADLDVESVQLEQIADDGSTRVAGALRDDGFQAGGDVIPGDDVFTGIVRVQRSRPGLVRFRVSARTLSQPDAVAWSPILSVPVVERVSTGDLDAAIRLADDARTLLANLAAAGVDTRDALSEVLALAYADGAAAAGPSAGGLGAWWITEQGLLGGVLAYDTSNRRGGLAAGPAAASAAPSFRSITHAPDAGALLQVGTRRSLILAPYFADEEPMQVDAMLRASQCPLFDVTTHVGADAGAERFKNLEEYGIILVASHGDALFDGLGDAYRPEWAWSSQGAQTVVLTGTTLNHDNLEEWEGDLRRGRMAVFPGGTAAILPTFIERYSIRLPASLVYVGSCRSAASPTMATTLFERGAAAYLGWDGYVSSAVAAGVGASFFTDLLQGRTAGEAFTPVSDGGLPPAHFTLAGEPDASLTADPVVNGSFEITSGFAASVTGFTVNGDARIVGELGSTLPTDGGRMALVSTGLGLTKDLGSFEQSVCLPPLPPGKSRLMLYYDWDFFSEEFLEYCGSKFQDSFEVTFGTTSLQSTKVDDLCGIVTPADVAFDKGDVHKTGWITQAVDVTALAGRSDVLRFGANDVGDSIYDSVILIDRVRIVAE
jgi:hypothetical protein